MPTDPIQSLKNIVENGSEAEAMQYIQDHLMEFPKEMQQRIVTGLFIEAAEAALAERMAVTDIKLQILSLLREFDALDKTGEDAVQA